MRNDQSVRTGRYTQQFIKDQAPPPAVPAASEEEGAEERAECFGFMLANRQAIMLDLRQVKGDRKALGYSYLVSVDFDGGGCIVLHFTDCKVKVEGTNLLPLFRRLVLHRVSYIKVLEAMHAAAMADTEPVVEAITVEDG
jgi:hypothetical protein